MGIPDHLTCLLRDLYAGQEAIVRTGHGTTDWFQIAKGVGQGCMLLPCLFNLHAEYIMWNAGLDEAQAGIKIAGRNINNLRYADDTTLMAESKEELNRLLMKVKESEKVGLKLNIQKMNIMASGSITSWQIEGETMATVRDSFFFFSFFYWLEANYFTTLQWFCHTLTWISHGFTCVPHPDPPSHLPLHLIPLGLPSAPGPSTCPMHPTWAGDLFHHR